MRGRPIQVELRREWILLALEEANSSLGRGANSTEIVEQLSNRQAAQLRRYKRKTIAETVSRFLRSFEKDGNVKSVGWVLQRSYWISTRLPRRAWGPLPTPPQSISQRVLLGVRDLVRQLGRAVRTDDVVMHASSIGLEGIDSKRIGDALRSHAEHRKLAVIGVVNGLSANLYLPRDLDRERYSPQDPLTEKDRILHAFREVWSDRLRAAQDENRQPTPPSTADVAARHLILFGTADAGAIVRGLGVLARPRRRGPGAQIRRVKSKTAHSLLWAPASVYDSELQLEAVFAKDVERAAEAVRRAEDRLGRPVTTAEARQEIVADPDLQPAYRTNFSLLLSSTAKHSSIGKRSHFVRVGRIGRQAAYTASEPQRGRMYVEFLNLQTDWRGRDPIAELELIAQCALPSVAVGRAMLMQSYLREVSVRLRTMSDELPKVLASEAQQLLEEVESVTAHLTLRLELEPAIRRLLPATVRRQSIMWDQEELWTQIHPVLPAGRERRKDFSERMTKYIRHERRPAPSAGRRRMPATILFDSTSALVHIGQQWGGYEASMQAAICATELGDLRDHRFVLPGFNSKNYEQRLSAVACCAFLWVPECRAALRSVAGTDADRGVRESAAWALGFSTGVPNGEVNWWFDADAQQSKKMAT